MFLTQKVQTILKLLKSFIVNGSISLDVISLLYKYKFRVGNLTQLYQYKFEGDDLIILIKIHVQMGVILTENINLALL